MFGVAWIFVGILERVLDDTSPPVAAWGVLGLATGGVLFSLLTLLFSGVITLTKPDSAGKVAVSLEKVFSVLQPVCRQ